VRRYLSLAVLALAAAGTARGGGDPLARFNVVAIKPASTSLFLATVSMSFQPFVLHRTVFSSTYSARVFPYFFWSEKGRIWIVVPADGLSRADHGETIAFTGHARNEAGEERKVEGHATPTGPLGGNIQVRVYVSRRIFLTYDSTYELRGAAPAQGVVIPR
jgi:hypothetical protein